MILVTGATGNVGAEVVRDLAARGEPVRAFVRDADRARAVLGEDVELAVGDFSDAGSLHRAMGGVDRVFLSAADGPQKAAQETAVIDAAAGARLIVKASTVMAEAGSPLPCFDWNGRIEAHLRTAQVPSVVLQSGFYMTNLLSAAEQVRNTGKLFAPAGRGTIAMIDPRDVGRVGATVLTGDGHEGHTYVLTGPEAIGYEQVAEARQPRQATQSSTSTCPRRPCSRDSSRVARPTG
ncbi:MAG TPA: NmrA family NAD(P)-binding protein [Gaiellaceae bacterium]